MKTDVVKIVHEVAYDDKFKPYLLFSKHAHFSKIVCHYMDGRVKVETGDVWRVRPVMGQDDHNYITSGVL